MTTLTLYAAEDNLQALAESAETVTPEQEQQFLVEFGAALLAAADKRDRVSQFLAHLEGQQALAAVEIKRLQERKALFERAQIRLEGYVVKVIEDLGQDAKGKFRRLEGHTATLSLRGCPASVEIKDESLVPLDYKRVSLTLPAKTLEQVLDALELELRAEVTAQIKESAASLDKKGIKAAIDAGTVVPGADLAVGKHNLVRG